jgi:hypothetical protein
MSEDHVQGRQHLHVHASACDGEPQGETKTVEGHDGMLQVNAYYDDDLKRLEPYGG